MDIYLFRQYLCNKNPQSREQTLLEDLASAMRQVHFPQGELFAAISKRTARDPYDLTHDEMRAIKTAIERARTSPKWKNQDSVLLMSKMTLLIKTAATTFGVPEESIRYALKH